jgi:predicted nucleic acid-binding protein
VAPRGFNTPDALQPACARQAGATLFVTNDMALRDVPVPEVLLLDEIAPEAEELEP